MKIVLFGGVVGSRLLPLSRMNAPKQFGKIIADRSMLQIAVHKLFPEFAWEEVYISTGRQYSSLISKQLPELPKDNIIVEPEMRDVGPAVGLVISQMLKSNPDEPLALLWGSDHLVKKEVLFRKMLRCAEKIVLKNPRKIVFVGQKSSFANQNLGYIEFGKKIETIDEFPVHEFTGFEYRPALKKAEEWLTDGKHAWNLGYFVTTPRFLWELFEEFSPELYKKLKQIHDAFGTDNYEKVLNEVYPTLEKISFDNAILEKMDPSAASVISADIGWSDIGAWEALKEALSDKVEANVTKGKILLEDCRDSILHNETKQLIVGIDLDGLVVVSMDDVILICPKDSVPKIKKFVQNLNGTSYEHLA